MNFYHPTSMAATTNDNRATMISSLPPNSPESSDYDIVSHSEVNAQRQRERREEELMHASFMTSTNSTVRIEINDEGRGGTMNALAASAILRKCKQQVFKPYAKLLLFIGWRPFGRERFNYHCGWKTLNIIYPVFVVSLLLYSYAYELLACQGKLDIDMHDITKPTDNPSEFVSSMEVTSTSVLITQTSVSTPAAEHNIFLNCNHVFTSYVVPDILHFIAFLLGFWYFRIQDNEQMYALIEQVFLLVTPLPRGIQTQTDMIRSMRRMLLFGAVWIFLMLAVQGIFLVAFGYEDFSIQLPDVPEFWNILLLSVYVFGSLIVNSINIAVVVNYAVQCETIIIYAECIKDMLHEKSTQLQNIMHDLHRVWQAILRLNGPMSNMTSICAFYFAEHFVIGLCLLILNKHHHPLVLTYRLIFPVTWFLILIFPFIQAVRVNKTLEGFREASLEVRVFGYHNSSIEELDSFQRFVASGRIYAKLMCIRVKMSYICGSVVTSLFVLIILMQTGVLTGKSRVFF